MLILGRRTNQSIVFPSCGVTVRILDINGKVAKVGIEAARNVEVLRGELVEVGSSSNAGTYSTSYEPSSLSAPEEPLLQLSQRVAELKDSLHAFQQLRARGDEAQADSVLSDVLAELALLDRDCLEHSEQVKRSLARKSTQRISESMTPYQLKTTSSDTTTHILIVNAPTTSGYLNLPNGSFVGCQISTANSQPIVQKSLASNEHFDFIICNDEPEGNLELVKQIRSISAYDRCQVFVTRKSTDLLEQVNQSNQFGIDGWLAGPLDASDLWSHIVESQQIED
ncbi:MAG: carbon storage regulator [Pirellula sp.]